VENNTASRSVSQHGIYVSNSCDRPTVRGNVCWGNYMCGIHMNGDATSSGDGLIQYALVENNIVYDNGIGGGSGINCDGVQDSVFRNNLLYNNHASGISLYKGVITAGTFYQDGKLASNSVPLNCAALTVPDRLLDVLARMAEAAVRSVNATCKPPSVWKLLIQIQKDFSK
jgi:parallel beta-helix repeat protein